MAAFYADLCSKYPIISIEVRAALACCQSSPTVAWPLPSRRLAPCPAGQFVRSCFQPSSITPACSVARSPGCPPTPPRLAFLSCTSPAPCPNRTPSTRTTGTATACSPPRAWPRWWAMTCCVSGPLLALPLLCRRLPCAGLSQGVGGKGLARVVGDDLLCGWPAGVLWGLFHVAQWAVVSVVPGGAELARVGSSSDQAMLSSPILQAPTPPACRRPLTPRPATRCCSRYSGGG